MSRKHNTKHDRSHGRYALRLEKRGESSRSVRMLSLFRLRRNAGMSVKQAAEGLPRGADEQ